MAEQLGLGRSTVVRLLDEAVRRGEVRIWIEEGEAELAGLAVALERRLGLDEAIVVPARGGGTEQVIRSVGLALGKFLSESVRDGMAIGVGWGRTLTASLAAFHPPKVMGARVMSLLGGSIDTHAANPVEYSWRLASLLDAQCFLFPAPLIVDSAETRRRLIEACGLDRLYRMAESLDVAVISAGDIGARSGSLVRSFLSDAENEDLVAQGCVGDVLCSFLDAEGRVVDHPIRERIMSVGVEGLSRAGHVVLATGGAVRAPIIRAALRATRIHTLVTDESAARALLG